MYQANNWPFETVTFGTPDEIKDAYDLYGSHFTSVEDFIKDNCDAVYQKQ